MWVVRAETPVAPPAAPSPPAAPIPGTVSMPQELTRADFAALKADPTTGFKDADEQHARLGWLLCAWDVLVKRHTGG